MDVLMLFQCHFYKNGTIFERVDRIRPMTITHLEYQDSQSIGLQSRVVTYFFLYLLVSLNTMTPSYEIVKYSTRSQFFFFSLMLIDCKIRKLLRATKKKLKNIEHKGQQYSQRLVLRRSLSRKKLKSEDANGDALPQTGSVL